jgi:hypothetical protein
MTRPPYNDARRVFWIVNNCSVHRGTKAVERLRNLYPRLTLIHAPVHASWLNQIEIYFSIVQRKVLTPNDLADLDVLAQRLLDYQYYWETKAQPFGWKFTRQVSPNSLPSSPCPVDPGEKYVSVLLKWPT